MIFTEINRRANREFLESGILGGEKKKRGHGVLDIMMK
ncbi:putative regulatory protein {ECO:0000313/EMBL:ADL58156,1} [Methanothermobacter wolfeii]|nr:putative regulatory protein {ECO:0000313/EMBL:ADL58156,1} [Methanothermobacter wolfeii]